MAFRLFILCLASGCGTAPSAVQSNQGVGPAVYANPAPASDASPENDNSQLKPGTWGSDSAALNVTANAASLKLACAISTFDQKPVPNEVGEFQASGIYQKLGGPVQQGDPRKYPATYTGQVNGDSLSLTVSYVDNTGTPQSGQYTLAYGDTQQVHAACPL